MKQVYNYHFIIIDTPTAGEILKEDIFILAAKSLREAEERLMHYILSLHPDWPEKYSITVKLVEGEVEELYE